MYSQNSEEEIILAYFKGYTGTLLSIGENDGQTLSNSLALIERGWKAVLIEPSPTAYEKLKRLHCDNDDVVLSNVALSDFNGSGILYESGEHLGLGDVALLSSLDEEETQRWGDTTTFEKKVVHVNTFKTWFHGIAWKKFHFINLDTEGSDLTILKQMNLHELGTKLICVEWNSMDKKVYDDEILPYGMRLIHKNAENLIYAI